MEKVFVSINAEGYLTITPEEEQRPEQTGKESPNLESVSEPGVVDSKGRLKLPADFARFLSKK
jgi:hypothetical protein